MAFPSQQSSLLTEFLNTVNRARVSKDAQVLANCLLLRPHDIASNSLMLSLRSELLTLAPAYIENKCYEILEEEWVSFTDLLIGYCGTYLPTLDVEGIITTAGGGIAALEGWHSALNVLVTYVLPCKSSTGLRPQRWGED